jgi:drug/metabolite transporter (DMT)-like permease
MIKKALLSLSEYIPARALRFITDCGSVLLEALIVLLIVHVPLVLSLIYKKMGKEDTSIFNTVVESYQVGDVLGYVAGLLASSTAYFVVRIGYMRYRPKTVAFLMLSPIIIIFFAAPVFFRDIDGKISYNEFTEQYILGLLISAALVWLYSLYQQKVIGRPSDNDDVKKLMNSVHRPD